jgi:predicted metalloprotease
VPAPRNDHRRPRAGRPAVALLLVGLLLSSCTRAIDGEPSAASSAFDGMPPGPVAQVTGGAGAPTDRLAASVVASVEGYWRAEFPRAFGQPWVNIHGFYAVDPKADKQPPPCLKRSLDLDNQAAYCPDLDTVAWDRIGLLPRLARTYGPGALVVALSHEIGHAVQNRLGIDATTQVLRQDRYPTILLEGMADCYAGSATQAVVAGHLPGLRVSRPELDRALRALLSFRDPIGGIGVQPQAAHGDAFDRASAFIDGYANGPRACAGMTVQNQVFTQRGYTSLFDQASGGNLALPDLVRFLAPDAAAWFGALVTARGRQWRAPAFQVDGTGSCAAQGTTGQGPARFCPGPDVLDISSRALGSVHDTLGDYASGAVLVSRYALAALAALGRPLRGQSATAATLCLTGAYTRAVFDRNGEFALSPGDIDEAVNELLDQNFAGRDVAGDAAPTDLAFERVQQFRTGVIGGPDRCGV